MWYQNPVVQKIIKEVAEEHGIEEIQVVELLESFFASIRFNTGVISFKIPKLGKIIHNKAKAIEDGAR